MLKKDFDILFDKIVAKLHETRTAGQKEYAHTNDDVFANFNRIAGLLDIDRKNVLMVYLMKHMDGITAYINGHKSQREDIRGRLTDAMVYLMLLWGMIDEDEYSLESIDSVLDKHGFKQTNGTAFNVDTGEVKYQITGEENEG